MGRTAELDVDEFVVSKSRKYRLHKSNDSRKPTVIDPWRRSG